MLPVVAIVGRPNVGKSTLLNRIVGRREAIVEERPGVTRDRKAVEAEWQGQAFTLIDTGGWLAAGSELDGKVSRQSEKAMEEADAVLFVVDTRTGLTEEDARAAAVVRKLGKPTFVVVNKVDHASREADAWEFVSLGLGNPWPVSALHGLGTGDLLDALVAALPQGEPGLGASAEAEAGAGGGAGDGGGDGGGRGGGWDGEPAGIDALADGGAVDAGGQRDDELFSVAIVGRPNVGKSTLFNRLIGDERSVVHDMPGTTRDAIDTVVGTDFGPVRFVDTAGMRRRSKIDRSDEEQRTEYYSMMRALRAVDGADVALLVIDATQGVTHQDQRLAERVDGAGCPIVIVLNKWELLDAEEKEQVTREAGDRLRFLAHSPTVKISALTGRGVHKLLPQLGSAISDYHARIPTATVNKVIREAQFAQPAPGGARVLYATQGAADPPTFTLFTNRDLPATYLRYLERKLREGCDLGATPVKLRVRRRS
jgi:GTP-binding protein